MGWDIGPDFLMMMAILVISIGLHEYGHAKFADLAGDPTPRMMGRVTLNPLKHLDPLGTVMMVLTALTGVGIGWGKPVMVRPDRMRNPRWDHFVSVLAGPVMNLLLAVFFALVYRGGGLQIDDGGLGTFAGLGVFINVSLMAFNLIPIGPLDGHWLLGAFLPEKQRVAWYQFNRGIGSILFIALVLLPGRPLSHLLGPIRAWVSAYLLGWHG